MKQILLILILIILLFQNSFSQKKLFKRMSNEICECLSVQNENITNDNFNNIFEACFVQAFLKNKSSLEKEYGQDYFTAGSEEEVFQKGSDLGKEIGLILTEDCQIFMKILIDLKKNKLIETNSFYDEGDSLYNIGKVKEAIDKYNEAIQIKNDDHNIYNSRGNAYFDLGKYYNSINDYSKSIEIEPNFIVAYYNLAYTKYILGDFESAVADINNGKRIDSTYCLFLNLEGLICLEFSEYDNALNKFKLAYECDSNNLNYYYNIGFSYYYLKKDKEAINIFENLYSKNYDSELLLSYIGNCYDNLNNHDQAIKFHILSIEKYPKDYIPYYNLAFAYKNYNKLDSAIKYYDKALKIDSTDSDIYYQKGNIYFKLNNFANAEFNYNKAIDMVSDNAYYYDARSALYEKYEKYNSALIDLKISLSLFPDDCNVHISIGRIYKKMSQIEEAKKSFQKAVELGCEESKALLNEIK